MQSTKTYLRIFIAFIFLVLSSCANPKADYEEVQKLLSASEQTIQQTADYDIRIKSCDDAMGALQAFLNKHKEGEWTNVAKNSLAAWESKKSAFQQELNSLSEELFSQLKKRAIEESKKVHSFSNIENINLENRAKSKDGYLLLVTDTYSVRMRGAIVGTSIFKLVVKVSGRIAMDSKQVFVDERATVEE
jgi:PBP1b-binding outer membrane lipoprotein LpoB